VPTLHFHRLQDHSIYLAVPILLAAMGILAADDPGKILETIELNYLRVLARLSVFIE
jgi:hypothetical protein